MKKPAPTFCLVEFPVFSDYTIHAESVASIMEAIHRYKIRTATDWDLTADAITIKRNDSGMSMIFFKGSPDLGTIAHECLHAVTQMFNHCGLENHDEENMAYHLGYAVNVICSHFRRK